MAVRGTAPGSGRLRYSFDVAALRRNFEPSDRSPALDRRDGENWRVGAGLQGAPTSALRVTGSVGWERQASEAKSESYSGGSMGVRIQRPVPGPFGDRHWSLLAAGQVSLRRYDAPDATIDPEHRRRDQTFALTLGLAIPFTETAAATLEAGRQWRRSNLPNFEYEDTSVSAGVRFSF